MPLIVLGSLLQRVCNMWLLFGLLAIGSTILNSVYSIKNRKQKPLFMAFALSFTALTLMAFHHQIANWINSED